ncbi:MAG TPA: hypothetical protein VLU47_02520 [Blastocatellia bacterium]|nr:hypothetical protein [Blastocatellia bacterium]
MAERTNLATRLGIDESGERSAEEIREDIAAERETISETVDKLGDRIQQTFDWREYVAEYPAVALGLAAGTGLLLSGVFTREPTPQERIVDALADLTEDLTERISGIAGDVITRKIIPGRTVKAAVTAIVAKAAIDFAKRKIGEAVTSNGHVERERMRELTREREALATL